MKKTILILMLAVSVMMSCTSPSTKSVSGTDSTAVDSTVVDTTLVAITDSVVSVVDTVK